MLGLIMAAAISTATPAPQACNDSPALMDRCIGLCRSMVSASLRGVSTQVIIGAMRETLDPEQFRAAIAVCAPYVQASVDTRDGR